MQGERPTRLAVTRLDELGYPIDVRLVDDGRAGQEVVGLDLPGAIVEPHVGHARGFDLLGGQNIFAKQPEWLVKEPIEPLKSIAKQFGYTEQSFNQCLANQKVLDSIQAVRDHAVDKLGVNSTPTFFINGKKFIGDLSIDQMAKEIDPYLKEG